MGARWLPWHISSDGGVFLCAPARATQLEDALKEWEEPRSSFQLPGPDAAILQHSFQPEESHTRVGELEAASTLLLLLPTLTHPTQPRCNRALLWLEVVLTPLPQGKGWEGREKWQWRGHSFQLRSLSTAPLCSSPVQMCIGTCKSLLHLAWSPYVGDSLPHTIKSTYSGWKLS